MPCDMVVIDEAYLKEQGWSPEEIAELQGDREIARQNARQQAMRQGLSRDQGAQLEENADQQARKVAHDRHHARMEERILAGEDPWANAADPDARLVGIRHGQAVSLATIAAVAKARKEKGG